MKLEHISDSEAVYAAIQGLIDLYPQNLILVFVKDMSDEGPVGSKQLASHHISHACFLLRHISDMVPPRIQDHVSICLFETTTSWLGSP